MNLHVISKIWIVVIVLAFVAGGILAWQYFGKAKDETANWQTYRNEEYGFEFKYPKDYFRNLISTSILQSNYLDIGEAMSLFNVGGHDYDSESYWPRLAIDYSVLSEESLKESLNKYSQFYGKSTEFTSESETVGGRRAFIEDDVSLNMGIVCESRSTFVPLSNGHLRILFGRCGEFQGPGPSPSLLTSADWDIRKKILSTFQFIDEMANWKTYTNKTYGYTIRFPKNYEVPIQTERENSQIGIDANTCVRKEGICFVTIHPWNNTEGLSLEKWINQYPLLYKANLASKTKFNNYEALVMKDANTTTYYVVHGSTIYQIGTDSMPNQEVSWILSTFRFVE